MTQSTTKTISKAVVTSAAGMAASSAALPTALVIAGPSVAVLAAPVAIAFGAGCAAAKVWDWLVD